MMKSKILAWSLDQSAFKPRPFWDQYKTQSAVRVALLVFTCYAVIQGYHLFCLPVFLYLASMCSLKEHKFKEVNDMVVFLNLTIVIAVSYKFGLLFAVPAFLFCKYVSRLIFLKEIK